MGEKQLEDVFLGVERRIQVSVSFLDCDGMNIVQFPKYLTYFEDGLVSLLHDLGYHSGQIFQERQIAFPVRELTVKYHKPAHFDEELEIVSSIESLGTTSMVTASKAYRDGELLAEGTSVRVCVSIVTGEKVPLVEVFHDIFSG